MKTKNRSRLASNLSTASVPQSQPLDSRQIKNSAGGFVYEVGCWDQLKRFLITGVYGGTYYINEKKLTKTNVEALRKCLDADVNKYVSIVSDISLQGRAAKNDFAVFALAYACVHSPESRKVALSQLNSVCRIGTHLFQFIEDFKSLGGGFGRSMRTAISGWYLSKTIDNLANQVIKYRNRNGWTHKDVFRVSHIKSNDKSNLIRYVIKGYESELEYPNAVRNFETLKTATPETASKLISQYDITKEYLPTNLHDNPLVMEELARKAPITFMIKNLGNMTSILNWTPTCNAESLSRTLSKLDDPESIKNGRVHPMLVLTALKQYMFGSGKSYKWSPNSKIISGLNKAFKHSVKYSEPTKLKILQAVDTSGSMHCMAGSNFECFEVGAVMSWVNACVEPYVRTMDFNSNIHNDNVVLHENMDVNSACKAFTGNGGTSLELPVTWALDKNEVFDLIIIYTDNETWGKSRHLQSAWEEYRKKNPKAKLVIASTAANQYSVGDPDDLSVLQVVGFDSSLLEIIKAWATS